MKVLIYVPVALSALVLAAPAPAQKSKGARTQVQDGYQLAFVDADAKRVVDAVLGSMLGVDYSVDPAVQGNITLRTPQPVPRAQLVPLLEGALRSVDAAIVAAGKGYRVVPIAQARARAPLASDGPTTGGATTDASPPVAGFASEIVTLRRAGAREIGRVLQQLLGKEVVAGTNEASNQIILTGTADERDAARRLIERFDVDSLANMNFELLRLENVDADTLRAELQKIFQPPYDIIGSRVRLVPLARLRSMLVIASDRADIAKVEPWIRRLDSGVSGKRRLYSYAVQNGRARDLASSLQRVLGVATTSSPVPVDPPSGPTTAFALGTGTGATGGTGGMGGTPASAAPSDVIGAQTPLPGSETPEVVPADQRGPRIVPNEPNNSLLIYADGEEYDFIRDALQKLDQPVAQVLIEATLAEVTLTRDLRFGVNFNVLSKETSVVNSSAATPIPTSIFPGFSVSVLGNTAQAVLNTLQSRTNVRVLSAPKLMVLNNQTATLQVGDQVPIVIQQSQSVAAPGAPIVNSIELRDTGVILKVTPRVNDSGTVTLDIAQEVSDVSTTTTSGINSPTIQQRRLASTVATQSGQMIALGGLIRDRVSRTKSGIPLLSQIPVVGGLFGTQSNTGTRTELIILLTPTVIRSTQDMRATVDALMMGLEDVRPLVDRALQRQVSGRPAPRR